MSREEAVRKIAKNVYLMRLKRGKHGTPETDWKEAEMWYERWRRESEAEQAGYAQDEG